MNVDPVVFLDYLNSFYLIGYLNGCSAALAIKVDPAWGAAAVLLC